MVSVFAKGREFDYQGRLSKGSRYQLPVCHYVFGAPDLIIVFWVTIGADKPWLVDSWIASLLINLVLSCSWLCERLG